MKYFIVFILLSILFVSFPSAKADFPDELFLQSENPELSVWRILSFEEDEYQLKFATGFFVEKNLFVTNFHVVFDILQRRNTSSIFLSQESNSPIVEIKRVVALSALYDLALLENRCVCHKLFDS